MFKIVFIFFIFHVFTLKITQRWKITHIDPFNNARILIYPKNIQFTLSEQNRPPPNKLSKLVNDNTTINLNIDYYFGCGWFSLTMALESFGDKLESVHCQWIYISDLPALGYLWCKEMKDEKR